MPIDGSQTDQVESWKEHNEGFRYEPPEGPPELWEQEDYQELYDRVIDRQVKWSCGKCSKPFPSLRRAREHVENNHSEYLISRASDE